MSFIKSWFLEPRGSKPALTADRLSAVDTFYKPRDSFASLPPSALPPADSAGPVRRKKKIQLKEGLYDGASWDRTSKYYRLRNEFPEYDGSGYGQPDKASTTASTGDQLSRRGSRRRKPSKLIRPNFVSKATSGLFSRFSNDHILESSHHTGTSQISDEEPQDWTSFHKKYIGGQERNALPIILAPVFDEGYTGLNSDIKKKLQEETSSSKPQNYWEVSYIPRGIKFHSDADSVVIVTLDCSQKRDKDPSKIDHYAKLSVHVVGYSRRHEGKIRLYADEGELHAKLVPKKTDT